MEGNHFNYKSESVRFRDVVCKLGMHSTWCLLLNVYIVPFSLFYRTLHYLINIPSKVLEFQSNLWNKGYCLPVKRFFVWFEMPQPISWDHLHNFSLQTFSRYLRLEKYYCTLSNPRKVCLYARLFYDSPSSNTAKVSNFYCVKIAWKVQKQMQKEAGNVHF